MFRNTRWIFRVTLGVALAAAAQPALAGWTHCTVDVYSAYDKAVKNGWKFECHGVYTTRTFVPLHAERKISCQGKTDLQPNEKSLIGRFFQKGSTSTSFYNGWKLHHYEVSGGNYTKLDKEGIKVYFAAQTKAVNTPWSRKLSKLVLKKENGNCSKVYDEAFVP